MTDRMGPPSKPGPRASHPVSRAGWMLAGLSVALLAQPARAATWPRGGNIELSASPGIFFSGDVRDYYGGDKLMDYGFGGTSFGLGIQCPVSPWIAVGARGEYSLKSYTVDVGRPSVSSPAPTYFTDHWSANAVGLLFTVQGRVPVDLRGRPASAVLGASAGVYSLMGASYENSLVDGRVDLRGRGLGGSIEGGLDLAGSRKLSLTALLGFG